MIKKLSQRMTPNIAGEKKLVKNDGFGQNGGRHQLRRKTLCILIPEMLIFEPRRPVS